MLTIKESFSQHIDIAITPALVKALNTLVLQFEIRGETPMTLNSPMFGVHKFFFTTDDRKMFFEIIKVDESEVAKLIREIPSIDNAFRVISDTFNLTCVYLVHKLLNSKLSVNEVTSACISVFNYMQYRFMSSAVNHYFPHNANYEIMQTVIESLNLKFAIKQYGTWKKVIGNRSLMIITTDSLHKDTIKNLDKDKDILYLITDMSTRIRSQLKIITAEYYAIRETNSFIRSHSATTELDGEKILREKSGSFELTSSIIYHKLINKAAFIDDHVIRMVQKSVPRLNTSIIKRTLISLSDEAHQQMEEGISTKIIHKRDDTEVYIGIETLLNKIIYVVYMSAIRSDRVNLNSKIAVYNNTKNIFTASRTADKELIYIKASIADFLKRTRITTRDSTVSGLTIAISLYITLLSFQLR